MNPLHPRTARTVPLPALDRFSRDVLTALEANPPTIDTATRAMLHASRLGVDSHGIRLLDHYVSVLEGGRVNKQAAPMFTRTFGGFGRLDNDNGHGALGAYLAMDHAMELAEEAGIGAVGVQNTSHFGPAGAYACEAALAGYVGIAFCNSDSFVRLHDGAERFHGTNPIAMGVPVRDRAPWLLDMATSAIPFNRVQLFKSLGLPLPEATASTARGENTLEAEAAEMLAPLGGDFGFKGAGLAGLAEIFSAVLTGMKLSNEILPMMGADKSTPRQMGAFVLALRPDAIISRAEFDDGIARYLEAVRGSATRAGAQVMAPGDREWAIAAERARNGVPIDPQTEAAFVRLSETYGVELPFSP